MVWKKNSVGVRPLKKLLLTNPDQDDEKRLETDSIKTTVTTTTTTPRNTTQHNVPFAAGSLERRAKCGSALEKRGEEVSIE